MPSKERDRYRDEAEERDRKTSIEKERHTELYNGGDKKEPRAKLNYYEPTLLLTKRASRMSGPGGATIKPEQLKAKYLGTGHADMTK